MQSNEKPDLLSDLERTIAGHEKRLEEIKAQEEWYRLLFNNGNDAVFVYLPTRDDQPSRFIEVNDVACKRLGYSREELLQMSPLDLVARQLQGRIFNDMQQLVQEKSLIVETVYQTRDGRQLPVEVSGHLFDLKGKRAVITFVRDITLRHQAQSALAESEAVLRTLINSSFDGALLIMVGGTILAINASAAVFFKQDAADLVGQDYFSLVSRSTAEERRAQVRRVQETGKPVEFESYAGNRVLKVSFNPVKDSQGGVTKLAVFARDITLQKQIVAELKRTSDEMERRVEQRTFELVQVNEALKREIKERKRTEEKLKLAQEKSEAANITKSEFLANISHELRNPLHQILSYSKMGVEKIHWVDQNKLQHYFTQIRTSGSRLLILLNDLLDLSKLESGQMDYDIQLNDVYQAVNEVLIELGPSLDEKRIRLLMAEPVIPTSVQCDIFKIGQVIRNLLSNAVRYSPADRAITIDYQKTLMQMRDNPVSAMQVSVRDQGVGIPDSELEVIFDRFTQSSKTKTGAGGTGLGLAICRKIVTAHQGRIWAENNPDGGATFFLVLPYRIE
ncbi:PAS domain S-box protein [bacterium]|nr:PAS domain S-box protein [bacterium]